MRDKLSRHRELWNRDELILAFDLYCRTPFNRTKANNPDVVALAKALGRSPASIARKLGNFGSFDPELQKRQIKGLAHVGQLDRQIWDEFHSDWNRLVIEASRLKTDLNIVSETLAEREHEFELPKGRSEKTTISKQRLHQSFFRDAVMSSYQGTCCITGLRIPEVLVAGHIIPWRVSEKLRADPRNGLCLSATFHSLYDCGLIAVTPAFRVVVSPCLLTSLDRAVRDSICIYHDSAINMPARFRPAEPSLEWHFENIFRR